ncbi:MAG: hypothetical protein WCK70_06095 [Chloroflexales bacterium]
MSHRSLFWPVTLIAIALATLMLMFVYAPVDSPIIVAVAANVCPTEDSAYQTCYIAATASAAVRPTINPTKILAGCPTSGPVDEPPYYPIYADCLKTRTAILLQTELAGATATSVPASANSSGSQPVVAATPTPTFTSTSTATSTRIASVTPQTMAILFSTPTASATPTATPSTDPLATDLAVIPCLPGDVIPVNGSASAEEALIVSFGGRPVGGGFSRKDGSYSILLRIGDERPGTYLVQVQERATRTMIRKFNCQVSATTKPGP